MTKRRLDRFIIPNFHTYLRALNMSPQGFAAISGLSLLTVKKLRQGLPSTKSCAKISVETLKVHGSIDALEPPRVHELTHAELARLGANQKARRRRRKSLGKSSQK